MQGRQVALPLPCSITLSPFPCPPPSAGQLDRQQKPAVPGRTRMVVVVGGELKKAAANEKGRKLVPSRTL